MFPASAAAQPVYGVPVTYAPTCYRARQPVTDVYGNVLYYRTVKICE